MPPLSEKGGGAGVVVSVQGYSSNEVHYIHIVFAFFEHKRTKLLYVLHFESKKVKVEK